MVEATRCGACGCELSPDSPGGLCPDCLLSRGLESDDAAEQGSAFARTTPQPGRFVPPEPAALAPVFPQLEILEPLGHGGMGAVYKARQRKLDRIVALKIIRPESADDPAFAERFNREARTLARLNHSNIVAIHDFGEVTLTPPDAADGTSRTLYYFLMEYVDGTNLRQVISTGELKPEQTLAVLPQICQALQYAHDEGIVHRDIKPENILVDAHGRVKIADFGLARLVSSSPQDFTLTATHQVMGTPQYMAPEQMSGSHGVDHRADIYSLGVVLYEMLTGEVPMGQFDPPSKRAPVDGRLDEVVLRALARDPERRYQQASEIQSSVEEISSAHMRSRSPLVMTSQSRGIGGISTIAEREVHNAWRWIAGETEAAAHDRPQLPALLMILMCVAGCLTLLLPWLDLEIDRTTTFLGSALELDSPVSQTFYGSDVWPGIAAAVAYGAFALLLIITPGDRPLTWKRAAVMMLLSGFLVYHTFLSRLHLESVSYPLSEVGEGVRRFPLRYIDHRITYRSGFYASLGLSLGLLLLSAIGVRRSLAYRSELRSDDDRHRARNLTDASSSNAGGDKPSAEVRTLPDFSRTVTRGGVIFLFLTAVAAFLMTLFAGSYGKDVAWVMIAGSLGVFAVGGIVLTIFGVVAMYEIRHSEGHLRGMEMAFAEAAVFPVLLIDAAIFASFALTIGPWASRELWLVLVLAGVIVSAVIDFILLRHCWRAVNPPSPSDTTTARIDPDDSAAVTPTSVPSRSASGRDWVTLTRAQVEHGELPDICVVCGTPSRGRVSKTFHYSPDWTVWLLFAGYFPGLFAILLTSKEMRVPFPVCPGHRRHWSTLVWVASTGWLLVAPLAGIGYLIGSSLYPTHGGPQASGAGIGALIAVLAWLATVIYLSCTRVTAESITDDEIRLKRVSPGFADAVDEGGRDSSA